MGKVAIIAESSCNLPAHLIQELNIHILPLRLIWEGESLRDGVDITVEEVYQRQELEDFTPETSTINPGELLKLINSISDQADSVVAIVLSSKLTSSVDVATLVQGMEPELPLHVIDSRTAAMAQGFIVLEAARAAATGADVRQVISRAQEIADRVYLLAALETLKYLYRLGRVGASIAQIGSALQIKPVIAVMPGNGSVVRRVRPRTWQKALESMIDSMTKQVDGKPVHAWVSHANQEEAAEYVAEEIRRRFDLREFYFTHLTPVMGAVAGPAVAVAFYTEVDI